MSPERLRQIEELYHAAREGTPEERAALLGQTDPELRRRVRAAALRSHRSAANSWIGPPSRRPGAAVGSDEMAAGACLGPYRIESKLGEGGMGQVFRAVDTRLGRAVAIKNTHEQFSARFERESRRDCVVNHPTSARARRWPYYLVMELVEGETLRNA